MKSEAFKKEYWFFGNAAGNYQMKGIDNALYYFPHTSTTANLIKWYGSA